MGAGQMNNPDQILTKIETIRCDRLHGASELAHTALGLLQEAVQESRAENITDFIKQIDFYASELSKARPTMVMIANGVDRFRRRFKPIQSEGQNLSALKLRARQAITEVITEIAQERDQTIVNGAALIHTGSVIMTCSYSSTVMAVLKMAAGQGKSFQVLALASNASCRYAQMTMDGLGKSGITGEVILENQLPEALPRADFILTGADAVKAGTLINGSPSLVLALAARDRQPPLPFYAVCEPLKFSSSIPPVLEPGFDLVPGELLTGVITAGPTIS